ncbi:MFS transporter [Paenibacillus sp. 79R4]|uniref:MFS transporter n=1 Tax=Paenibacillus sp. 79R4 TaxID=2212847 RepID=UPI0015C02F80|nr:MFS transporter [Paenibacillus sp. 79R4]NWL86776.1 MFS transporter [Paenibacillus sp. 79R4]
MLLEDQERLWTKSFISLTICSFLMFLNLQMLLSTFPAYVKNEFHAGDFQVSLVTSVFAASAIMARFLTAGLIKSVPRDKLLYVGLIIATIATGIYSLAESVGGLLTMRVGFGLGFGISSTILPTLASQIIPVSRMGEGIGYFGLSSSLAMSFGPMVGLNVMSAYGFSRLTIVATLTVILILPILLFSRAIAKPSAYGQKKTAKQSGGKHVKPKFNHKMWFPALLNAILCITYSGLLGFIALFGQFIHLEQVGLFFLFNVITIVIVRPISGRLFDRRGHAAVLIPAAIFVVASMVVLSYTRSLPLLIVSALLYGLGFGAIQPTLQAWMIRTSTPEQYGTANSMFYNSTDFGVAIGSIILGLIASFSNYSVMYRYSAGFMVLFLLLYCAVQFGLRSKKRVQSVNIEG